MWRHVIFWLCHLDNARINVYQPALVYQPVLAHSYHEYIDLGSQSIDFSVQEAGTRVQVWHMAPGVYRQATASSGII